MPGSHTLSTVCAEQTKDEEVGQKRNKVKTSFDVKVMESGNGHLCVCLYLRLTGRSYTFLCVISSDVL